MHSRVRLKICGMTRPEDAGAAAALGVDAIGLILVAGSKRHVGMTEAARIVRDLPPFVDVVAVMVNPEPAWVETVLTQIRVHCLQFHGEESNAFCSQFGLPFIKALPATSESAMQGAADQWPDASALLLDTPSPERGGTGKAFDWGMIPREMGKPVILAGGLHIGNVMAAVDRVHPFAVDISTGVEDYPGEKSVEKMMQLTHVLWGKA